MSERDVRPTALMRQLDEDEAVVSSISKTARRVKIEKNHTWNMRLLPVQMGPDKMPYVRLAQHWWNKSPIVCPTFTPKGFGGNPDVPCPICELSDRLNESSSQEIRDLGYGARCVLRFRFWCVVFDMEDARGRIDELPLNEVLNPYEFDMYKTTWEDFKKYQKWATTRRKDPSEWGLLDLESGCNLLATHGNKGVRLERSDPSPIFNVEDKNFDSYIQKIWERLRKPTVIIPGEKQLLETAIKIEEYAVNGGRKGVRDDDDRGSRRGGSRSGFRDRGGEEDRGGDRDRGTDDDDRGSRRGRFSGEDNDADTAPRSRRSAPPEDAPVEDATPVRSRRAANPEPEEQQESAVPQRRAAQTPPPPTRRAAPPADEAQQEEAQQEQEAPVPQRRSASAPAPARRQPEANDQISDEDLNKDSSPDAPEAPTPPAKRVSAAGPAPARRSAPAPAAQEEAPPEEAQQEQPQRPPTRRAAPAAQVEPPIGEDEETVTDERKDQAPPVKEKVDDAPVSVKTEAPVPKRGNASDLQSRLARLTEKGK